MSDAARGRLLYIDAIAGVAGDMLLGALLDAGAPLQDVQAGLDRIGIAGLRIEVAPTTRHGLAAASVRVLAPSERQPSRDWGSVRALIDAGRLPPRAHDRAHETFRRLAHAEAAVHRIAPDRVHFHEVGAIDAIADVCGVALALEALGVDRVVCSPLPVGRGLIAAAHGILPLPAPATLELLRQAGAPLYGVEAEVELVTPTGAALVAALAEGFGTLPPLNLEAVGCGAGARELPDRPNIVRVLLGDAGPRASIPAEPSGVDAAALAAGVARRDAVLLECTLDDLSGELVADGVRACMGAGALDAWLTPVQMKKGRPGVVLTAVARPERESAVAQALLCHTSTLGVRVSTVSRWELARERLVVAVDGQAVGVKLGRLGDEVVNVSPEHDDVARVAVTLGRPAKRVWGLALAAALRELELGRPGPGQGLGGGGPGQGLGE